MNLDLIKKINFSTDGQHHYTSFPLPLKDSLQLISAFFSKNNSNKLCLVFPSKEFAAQWLSLPTVLFLIENDFNSYKDEISETYKQFKKGDKLLLNNTAIVEWVGVKHNGVAFKTKGTKDSSGAEITIKLSDVIMLQKAPATRQSLSALKKVKEVLPSRIITPTEKLLNIETHGNKDFIKHKVCLVTRYKSFYECISTIKINDSTISDYFETGKLDENGSCDVNCPIVLTNNLNNLGLYLTSNKNITKIIIDGFSMIADRNISDFNDIESLKLNIPTILITDLSEIDSFQNIGNFGFEFFNFTKENIRIEKQMIDSPFHVFNEKLEKYCQFNIKKEICQDHDLEIIIKCIHSIEKDDSNDDLNFLKFHLIQFTNYIARICHFPPIEEFNELRQKLALIENKFQKTHLWLGDSHKNIETSINLLKSVIEKFTTSPSAKCVRLNELLGNESYDYIICPKDDEAHRLRAWLPPTTNTCVISINQVNDTLLSSKSVKAILIGWARSEFINRILTSYLFNELIVLFYGFEDKYFKSLQRRNFRIYKNIKPTINKNGLSNKGDKENQIGFSDQIVDDIENVSISEGSFDILEYELRLDNSIFSKYTSRGNLFESIKAKRIDFDNNMFVYSSESHKFLIINDIFDNSIEKASINRKPIENIKFGDVIVLINTDSDILAKLVESKTNSKDLAIVKQWTDLWKNLLKKYYLNNNGDFKKLVDDLRENGCKRHEATIKAWLQDETRIGPNDDSDLISIALLTGSTELLENINKVREAISKMTGWRMQSADIIANRIKTIIPKVVDESFINSKVDVEGLGSATILKVNNISRNWVEIDSRYVNRLLIKDSF